MIRKTAAQDTGAFAPGRVALTVNDLATVGRYYEQALGLHPLARDGGTATYGAGETVLLELRQDRHARRRTRREAGLFHTAFLLPSRRDLGRWLRHAAAARIPVTGSADHLVSEAVYLDDPEGNGIEIYADRPADGWTWSGGGVRMATEPLDLAGLMAAAGGEWSGAPEGTTIGHVHLQTGALAPAEAFYAGVLGLDVTARYPGAEFYSANGYHHHLAANIWNSRGAGERSCPATGLADLELRLDPARAAAIRARAGISGDTLHDPWGTALTLVTG